MHHGLLLKHHFRGTNKSFCCFTLLFSSSHTHFLQKLAVLDSAVLLYFVTSKNLGDIKRWAADLIVAQSPTYKMKSEAELKLQYRLQHLAKAGTMLPQSPCLLVKI